jgi:membrane-associated phospholipid phosphatase
MSEPDHGARRATPLLAPVAVVPVVAIAVVLFAFSALFLGLRGLNLEGFAAVQAVTIALPDRLWAMVTLCGTGVVAFALLSPTAAWQPRWFAAAIVAAAFAGLYTNVVKRALALPRPASVLDPAHLHIVGERLSANSFPSGHSVTSFTLAAILVLASRRPLTTALWAVPCAALVAISRIAVGAHWPADLAAGAAGGWVSGALAVVCIVRWRVWNTINGVRAMGVVAIGIGVSLFIVDLGYPLALGLQYLAGALAVGSGIAAVTHPRLDPLLPYRPTP